MDRTFQARISSGQYLALAVPTILAVHGLWVKNWLVALVFVLLLVWFIEYLIHTRYTLTADGFLVVGHGRFNRVRRIPLADILLVERSKAMFAGLFPINHFVLVHYKGGRVLSLQPVNEDEFVHVLEKRMKA